MSSGFGSPARTEPPVAEQISEIGASFTNLIHDPVATCRSRRHAPSERADDAGTLPHEHDVQVLIERITMSFGGVVQKRFVGRTPGIAKDAVAESLDGVEFLGRPDDAGLEALGGRGLEGMVVAQRSISGAGDRPGSKHFRGGETELTGPPDMGVGNR